MGALENLFQLWQIIHSVEGTRFFVKFFLHPFSKKYEIQDFDDIDKAFSMHFKVITFKLNI